MQLAIRHRTRYRYDPAVAAVGVRLKLYPPTFAAQHPVAWTVAVNGVAVAPGFRDGWGDQVATHFVRGEVAAVEIEAAGVVDTRDEAGVVRGLREAVRPGMCLRATPRTEADSAIAALAREALEDGGTQLQQAHRLQDLVTARIAYRAGHTDGATTAPVALASGAGVCQDHAHVVIAAARSLGWPARYVAGYCLHAEDGGDDVATHAWAELWLDGIGWVGFDASNDLCPTDAYVRLCAGLDAFDAAPIRGHVEGAGAEALDVRVAIHPAGAEQ
ncbi:MAG: transglutaminase family protein [Alphaproteobacteria bacterium]|jgi:transglutaminase-like putative cysteine protease|nr:transglutaminase family protein [Alphaproteobacteria bacterium]